MDRRYRHGRICGTATLLLLRLVSYLVTDKLDDDRLVTLCDDLKRLLAEDIADQGSDAPDSGRAKGEA